MKRLSLLLIVLLSVSIVTTAQTTGQFSYYVNYLRKEANIKCKMPKYYVDTKEIKLFAINSNHNIGSLCYGVTSVDSLSQILYDSAIDIPPKIKKPRIVPYQIKNARDRVLLELFAAYCEPQKRDSNCLCMLKMDLSSIQFEKYVTIKGGLEAETAFNADTIYLYSIPLDVPYEARYHSCTGLAILKRGKANMYVKYFSVEAQPPSNDEILSILRKNIWYKK